MNSVWENSQSQIDMSFENQRKRSFDIVTDIRIEHDSSSYICGSITKPKITFSFSNFSLKKRGKNKNKKI